MWYLYTFIFLCILLHHRCEGSLYKHYSFENECPGDGSKRELPLRNGAAVLKLNIPGLPHNFNCHLELEASKDMNIHVYIDEMNLVGDENSSNGGCSEDFLQFGRDVIYFTTHKSLKYCGIRSHVDFSRPDQIRTKLGNRSRMYIEKKDYEMDVWLSLKGHPNTPRNLTLVVTAYKKRCSQKDIYYRQCRHSNHCIHRKLFCDAYPNCAWPEGDIATDEKLCEGNVYVGGTTNYAERRRNSSFFNNLPVIIIVVIVSIAVGIVFVVGLINFLKSFKNSRRLNNASCNVAPRSPREEVTPSPLLEPSAPNTESSPTPSAPPSYDQVIENSPAAGTVLFVDNPPPYTPPQIKHGDA